MKHNVSDFHPYTLESDSHMSAMCCGVLQCVAVCCRGLQCVAVCCSMLQCGAGSLFDTYWGVILTCLQGVAGCCSVLQRVAVCCIVVRESCGYLLDSDSYHMHINQASLRK